MTLEKQLIDKFEQSLKLAESSCGVYEATIDKWEGKVKKEEAAVIRQRAELKAIQQHISSTKTTYSNIKQKKSGKDLTDDEKTALRNDSDSLNGVMRNVVMGREEPKVTEITFSNTFQFGDLNIWDYSLSSTQTLSVDSPPVRFNIFFLWICTYKKLFDEDSQKVEYLSVYLECVPIDPTEYPIELTVENKFKFSLCGKQNPQTYERSFKTNTFTFQSKDKSGETVVRKFLTGDQSDSWGNGKFLKWSSDWSATDQFTITTTVKLVSQKP